MHRPLVGLLKVDFSLLYYFILICPQVWPCQPVLKQRAAGLTLGTGLLDTL